MSGCGARTAAGSLEAVFESSDAERFGWVLMEVQAAKPGCPFSKYLVVHS
jgi:hypothetical protein